MRQILSRSLLTVAAAGSVLAVAGGYAQADSGANGTASGSPGVLSGNSVEVPLDAQVNACGNTVDVVGLLNPTFGNSCANHSSPTTPPQQVTPPHTGHTPKAPPVRQVAAPQPLAETGMDGREVGTAGATAAALLLGGALLYRRASRASRATARVR